MDVSFRCLNLCLGAFPNMYAQHILLEDVKACRRHNFTLISLIQSVALGLICNSIILKNFKKTLFCLSVELAVPLFVKGISYGAKKFRLLSKEIDLNERLRDIYERAIILGSIAALIFLTLDTKKYDLTYFITLSIVCISVPYHFILQEAADKVRTKSFHNHLDNISAVIDRQNLGLF